MSELQAYSRNLASRVDELVGVSEILRDDIGSLLSAYQDEWSDQALRRAFVRASWAMVEGVVFCVKQFTLRACELGSVSLPADEHVFLSELRFIVDPVGNTTAVPVHEDTLSNLKHALKIAASRFELSWKPDFGGSGWQDLASSLSIRHRITHPKSSRELDISDAELSLHKSAFEWFILSFNDFQNALLAKHGKRAP